MGERARSLETALQKQEELKMKITKITEKFDDFQNQVDDVTSDVTATRKLVAEINSMADQISEVERETQMTSQSKGGDVINAISSILFERWETLRMKSASKLTNQEVS